MIGWLKREIESCAYPGGGLCPAVDYDRLMMMMMWHVQITILISLLLFFHFFDGQILLAVNPIKGYILVAAAYISNQVTNRIVPYIGFPI